MIARPPRCLRLRRLLNESQHAFAARLGQSQGTVYRLEAGQPETGPQKLLLDLLEQDIANGRIPARAPEAPPRPTILTGLPACHGEGGHALIPISRPRCAAPAGSSLEEDA